MTQLDNPHAHPQSWLQKQHFIVKMLAVFVLLFIFLIAVSLLEKGISTTTGKEEREGLLAMGTNNPLIGFFIGLLATALIQSSSSTTTIIVGLVAARSIPLTNAVFMVMGANMGTTVTNILVSMGHITRPDEFRRAFGAAVVHDIFNFLTILIILPIEWMFHPLEKFAQYIGPMISDVDGFKGKSPLKIVLKKITGGIKEFLHGDDYLQLNNMLTSVILIALALIFLFLALYLLSRILKVLMKDQVESTIDRYLKKSGYLNILIGAVITFLVQSSSVTTSILVPLVAGQIIKLERAFPLTIGANIGTTATALLASMAVDNPLGLQIAIVHTTFNICGLLIFYPIEKLRRIPIYLARQTAQFVYHKRYMAIVFTVIMFYVIPGLSIFLYWFFYVKVG